MRKLALLALLAPLLWVGRQPPQHVPSMRQAPIFHLPLEKKTLLPETSRIPAERGVYCAYDVKGRVMYIGLSMNLRRSIETLGRDMNIYVEIERWNVEKHGECEEPCPDVRLEAHVEEQASWREMWQDGECDQGAATKGLEVLVGGSPGKRWELHDISYLLLGGELPPGNMPKDAPGADHFWQQRGREVQLSVPSVRARWWSARSSRRDLIAERSNVLKRVHRGCSQSQADSDNPTAFPKKVTLWQGRFARVKLATLKEQPELPICLKAWCQTKLHLVSAIFCVHI